MLDPMMKNFYPFGSRKEHVYAVFHLKAMRILQEREENNLELHGNPREAELSRVDTKKIGVNRLFQARSLPAYETPPDIDLSEQI